eukprot:98445_1
MCFSLLLLLLVNNIPVRSVPYKPDIIYDIKDSLNHTINCGESQYYLNVNFDPNNDKGKNYWFKWETTETIKYANISVLGETNKWIYLVYDEHDDAKWRYLTISHLIEICHNCSHNNASIDIAFADGHFSHGIYWIGVNGNFNLTLNCKHYDYSMEKVEILWIAISSSLLGLLCIIGFICAVCANKHWEPPKHQENQNIKRINIFPGIQSRRFSIIAGNEQGLMEIINNNTAPTSAAGNVELIENENKTDTDVAHNENNNDNCGDSEEEEKEKEKEFEKEKEDETLAEIFDALEEIGENNEGLDIYQVLAFRIFYIPEERPDYALQITWEQQAWVAAIITAILQTFGIVMALYDVVNGYFGNNFDPTIDTNSQCEWRKEFWENGGIWFKLLAFLWAFIITLTVSKFAKQLLDQGLNHLLHKMIKKIPKTICDCCNITLTNEKTNIKKDSDALKKLGLFVNSGIILAGIFINMFTLVCAVGGGFFMIYASEASGEAVDMVLNAVALYFMIEVDDLLVMDKDYEDLKTHREHKKKLFDEKKKKGELKTYLKDEFDKMENVRFW